MIKSRPYVNDEYIAHVEGSIDYLNTIEGAGKLTHIDAVFGS